jgi:hypothetical protein
MHVHPDVLHVVIRGEIRLLERALVIVSSPPHLFRKLIMPRLHADGFDGYDGVDAACDAVAFDEVVPVFVDLTVLAQQVVSAQQFRRNHPHSHQSSPKIRAGWIPSSRRAIISVVWCPPAPPRWCECGLCARWLQGINSGETV